MRALSQADFHTNRSFVVFFFSISGYYRIPKESRYISCVKIIRQYDKQVGNTKVDFSAE